MALLSALVGHFNEVEGGRSDGHQRFRQDDPRYRRWVVATTCGELAGFAIPAIAGATATSVGVAQSTSMVLLVLAGVGEGTVLGWALSRMLRRELPRLGTGDWVGATAAGAAAAWTIGMLPSTLHAHLVELWPSMLIAFGALVGVLLLASIGFAQWLVLRRHLDGVGYLDRGERMAWIAVGGVRRHRGRTRDSTWIAVRCGRRLGHGAHGGAGHRPVPGPAARLERSRPACRWDGIEVLE